MGYLGQTDFGVRLDWGPVGAEACGAEVSIVVDVLSFSTAVTVAVERETVVFPCAWRDPRAAELARSLDAVLAVGRWAAEQVEAGRTVALIAAGERWAQDGSLRPALEDHLGAGAIAQHLLEAGHGNRCSPETVAAARLFAAALPDLAGALRTCVSGQELVGGGFAADVEVAAALDASDVVPILREGAFSAW